MSHLTILFVTTHKYLPELRGGMEVNTHQLCKALQHKGHKVAVCCGLAGVGFIGYQARLKIKLLNNKCPYDSVLGYKIWRSWNPLEHIEKAVGEFKPDIVVVQGGHQFYALIKIVLALNLPVVAYLHTPDKLPLPEELKTDKNLAFIANSQYTASIHKDKKIQGVFPPIIKKSDYFVETTRKKILYVNPEPHKGVSIVLKLAKARPDVEFIFVVNKVQDKKNKQLMLKNISIVGPIKDMRDMYRYAKLILAPSIWQETWGRIVTEAHCSGIPVLASNNGGLPESVGDGGICLSVEDNDTEWLETFDLILDNREYYTKITQKAYESAMRDFINPELIIERFISLLNNTINN